MTCYEGGAALIAAKREIAARLRRVCDYLDDAQFEALVSRIASLEVKYQMRDVFDLFYRPADSCEEPQATGSKGMNSAA